MLDFENTSKKVDLRKIIKLGELGNETAETVYYRRLKRKIDNTTSKKFNNSKKICVNGENERTQKCRRIKS